MGELEEIEEYNTVVIDAVHKIACHLIQQEGYHEAPDRYQTQKVIEALALLSGEAGGSDEEG